MIKPMLAYKVGKKPVDWSEKVYIQPKLDGIRCVIYVDDNEHIKLSLRKFFFDYANVDVVLDGELYNHKLRNDFEKIVSLVRKQKPTEEDRRNAQHLIQFHCYDYIETVMDKPYSYRSDQLACADFYDASIKYVETNLVNSKESAQLRHQYNLNN